jgi:hypothetical protein
MPAQGREAVTTSGPSIPSIGASEILGKIRGQASARSDASAASALDRDLAETSGRGARREVELRGLEPLASCMPCKRSTN